MSLKKFRACYSCETSTLHLHPVSYYRNIKRLPKPVMMRYYATLFLNDQDVRLSQDEIREIVSFLPTIPSEYNWIKPNKELFAHTWNGFARGYPYLDDNNCWMVTVFWVDMRVIQEYEASRLQRDTEKRVRKKIKRM